MSIELIGFGSEEKAMRLELTARMSDAQIQVLPDGQYPKLRLNEETASGSFYNGMVPRTTYGNTVVLRVTQLVTLGQKTAAGTTYTDWETGAGLIINYSGLRSKLLDRFFTDYKKENPRTISNAGRPGTLKDLRILAVQDDDWDPPQDWGPEKRQRWYSHLMGVSDVNYKILYCTYFGEGKDNWHEFWYKIAPPNIDAKFAAEYQGGSILKVQKAVDGCPATTDEAGPAIARAMPTT